MAKRISTKSLHKLLVAGIASRAKRVLAFAQTVAANPSTDATHALSTSLRRVLTVQAIVKQWYGKRLLKKTARREVNAFRKVLGAVRDAQEIRAKFLQLDLQNPFARAFCLALDERETEAKNRIVQALEQFDLSPIKALSKKKVAASLLPAQPRCKPSELLEEIYDEVVSFFPEAIENEQDKALHKMRVAYKKYRYTIELFTPEILSLDNKQLKYLRALQEAMGEAHDWYVMNEEVRACLALRPQSGQDETLAAIAEHYHTSHAEGRAYVMAELPKVRELAQL